jgi:hypothetical protein
VTQWAYRLALVVIALSAAVLVAAGHRAITENPDPRFDKYEKETGR